MKNVIDISNLQEKTKQIACKLNFSIDVVGRIVTIRHEEQKKFCCENNNNVCILGGANG